MNHLVVSAEAFQFLYGHKKYNQRSGRKRINDKRTIWAWVNSMCKKGDSVTLHSLCICRLSLACIFREISSKLRGMPTHLDWSSLTADCCWLPLCVFLRQLPSLGSFFQLVWLAFPYPLLWLLSDLPFLAHFRSRRRSRFQDLCLVSRQNRQMDRLLSGPPTSCHKVLNSGKCKLSPFLLGFHVSGWMPN